MTFKGTVSGWGSDPGLEDRFCTDDGECGEFKPNAEQVHWFFGYADMSYLEEEGK